MDIDKYYARLQKEHPLPKFEELDYEFDVSSIEHERFLLRDIVRKIREKIQTYIDILNEILQPDANSFASIYEFRFFDDSDKKEIYRLFKKLMIIYRSSYLVEITDGDPELAKLITSSYRDWCDIKKTLPHYIEKMRDSWKQDVQFDEELGYLG